LPSEKTISSCKTKTKTKTVYKSLQKLQIKIEMQIKLVACMCLMLGTTSAQVTREEERRAVASVTEAFEVSWLR